MYAWHMDPTVAWGNSHCGYCGEFILLDDTPVQWRRALKCMKRALCASYSSGVLVMVLWWILCCGLDVRVLSLNLMFLRWIPPFCVGAHHTQAPRFIYSTLQHTWQTNYTDNNCIRCHAIVRPLCIRIEYMCV